jgi:hypothetical protein
MLQTMKKGARVLILCVMLVCLGWELLFFIFYAASVVAIGFNYTFWLIQEAHFNMKAGQTRVETGSNTSTVTLRVVGGDEKEVSNLRQ